MKVATINVKYVNPPKGKGPASVKDDQGKYWKFWTRDIPLDTFAAGQSYQIGYKTEPYNGEDQFYIENAIPAAPAQSNGSKPAPQQEMRRTSPTDAERMFVCSLLNASIQAGKVDPNEASITASTNAFRKAWQATFGQDA